MSNNLVPLDREPHEPARAALPMTSAQLDAMLAGLIQGRDRALLDRVASIGSQLEASERRIVDLVEAAESRLKEKATEEGARIRTRTNILAVIMSCTVLGLGALVLSQANPGVLQAAIEGLLKLIG